MGFRPISHYFADMVTYSKSFLNYQSGATLSTEKDVLFEYFNSLNKEDRRFLMGKRIRPWTDPN
jgi:hypothetical protein